MSRLYLFASLALGVLVVQVLRRLFKFRNYPSVPGPSLAKHTRWWYAWKTYGGKFEQWNVEAHAKYGPIVQVAPGMYSICSPEAVKQFYSISSPMPKSAWYQGFNFGAGTNGFSERDRKTHAGIRKGVANLYAMTSIKSYEPYVNTCVTALQEHFDRLAREGASIDVQRWMQAYAFDVISEITFGNHIGFMDSENGDVDGIVERLDRMTGIATMRGIDPRLEPLWRYLFGDPVGGMITWSEKLKNKRREIGSLGAQDDFFAKLEIMERKDPETYNKYRLGGTMFGNLAAGSDTTSIALTSILFNIIRHREVYLKLKDEIRQAEGRGQVHDPILFEEAQAMPYLQRVVKEALRVHPSTGLPLWRDVVGGGTEVAGKFFPPGAIVGVNSWVAHNDPEVFENPSVFNPDRWDPEVTSPDKLKVMESCYIPFGSGTRTCVGKNISFLEMNKLIPQLVRRYDFELLSPQAGQPMESTNWWFVKQHGVIAKIRT